MRLALAGLLLVAGCGSGAGSSVDDSRAQVQQAARDAVEAAATAGVTVSAATGSWTVCSAEPPRLKYGVGGAGTATTDVPEAIAAVTAALEAAGWSVERSGTDPEPYATLTRDDVRASLGASRRHPGQVSLGLTGPCIATTDAQDSLLGEEDQVLP